MGLFAANFPNEHKPNQIRVFSREFAANFLICVCLRKSAAKKAQLAKNFSILFQYFCTIISVLR